MSPVPAMRKVDLCGSSAHTCVTATSPRNGTRPGLQALSLVQPSVFEEEYSQALREQFEVALQSADQRAPKRSRRS